MNRTKSCKALDRSRVHPDYYRTSIRNRIWMHNKKAQALGVPGTFTVDEWLFLLDQFGGKCAHCGAYETRTPRAEVIRQAIAFFLCHKISEK